MKAQSAAPTPTNSKLKNTSFSEEEAFEYRMEQEGKEQSTTTQDESSSSSLAILPSQGMAERTVSSRAEGSRSNNNEARILISGGGKINEEGKKNESEWELTWPIWHLLPHRDRKELAHRHGFSTIGDFEEYMILQRAVDQTEDYQQGQQEQQQQPSLPIASTTSTSRPYPNQSIYQIDNTTATTDHEDDDDDDDDYEEEDDGDQVMHQYVQSATKIGKSTVAREDSLQVTDTRQDHDEDDDDCPPLFLLPEDVVRDFILEFCPVASLASLALVSRRWHPILHNQAMYKRICHRIYLHQCGGMSAKALHAQVTKRFGGLYYNMLCKKPRVLTSGGLYVFKFAKVKQIQRDMWTQIPRGVILETVYYRYLYFLEQPTTPSAGDDERAGIVLYALTTTPPSDMIGRFVKVVQSQCYRRKHQLMTPNNNITTSSNNNNNGHYSYHYHQDDTAALLNYADKAIVQGHFRVRGKHVTILARQEWHTVKFSCCIHSNSPWGRFGALTLERHLSSASGDFDEYFSRDLVEYKVPHSSWHGLEHAFRYIRDSRL